MRWCSGSGCNILFDAADRSLLRWSLIVVWLLTAVVSIVEWQGRSSELLAASGVVRPWLRDVVIGAGVAVDLLLGLALWRRPGRATYLLALGMMLAMTVAATVLQPGLWLHPLGPLLKNLPIGALLWVLARRTP